MNTFLIIIDVVFKTLCIIFFISHIITPIYKWYKKAKKDLLINKK